MKSLCVYIYKTLIVINTNHVRVKNRFLLLYKLKYVYVIMYVMKSSNNSFIYLLIL